MCLCACVCVCVCVCACDVPLKVPGSFVTCFSSSTSESTQGTYILPLTNPVYLCVKTITTLGG